jgi:hypothetical protein
MFGISSLFCATFFIVILLGSAYVLSRRVDYGEVRRCP